MRINTSPVNLVKVDITFLAEPPAERFEQFLLAQPSVYDLSRNSLSVSFLCRDRSRASEWARECEQKWLAELRQQRQVTLKSPPVKKGATKSPSARKKGGPATG